MMSSNTTDPFIQVQTDTQHVMAQTRQQFSSYIRIRSLSAQSGKPSPELVSAKADLEGTLNELSEDLKELHAAVKAVEADPYAYGLDVEEVSRRRRFVRELEAEVEEMMDELKKTVQQSIAKAQSAADDTGGSNFEDEQQAREWEMQQQQAIMAEQDEALEDVSRTIGNIRQHAHEMGRELEEQSEMLNALDRDTDRVENKLKNGMKRMTTIIRENEDTYSSCCIGVLIFVLIVLLVVLLVF